MISLCDSLCESIRAYSCVVCRLLNLLCKTNPFSVANSIRIIRYEWRFVGVIAIVRVWFLFTIWCRASELQTNHPYGQDCIAYFYAEKFLFVIEPHIVNNLLILHILIRSNSSSLARLYIVCYFVNFWLYRALRSLESSLL